MRRLLGRDLVHHQACARHYAVLVSFRHSPVDSWRQTKVVGIHDQMPHLTSKTVSSDASHPSAISSSSIGQVDPGSSVAANAAHRMQLAMRSSSNVSKR